MATLIKNRAIASNNWQTLSSSEELLSLSSAVAVIVPLAAWQAQREALIKRTGKLGVHLEPHEDVAALARDLGRLDVVAVNFPKFSDGRGLSIARLLRERYGYRGEVRAVGDVLRDQLQEMERCGFDAFDLRADQDAQAALGAFADLSDQYQTSALQPLPLFRRRVA